MGKYKTKTVEIYAVQFDFDEWLKTPSKYFMVDNRPISAMLPYNLSILTEYGNEKVAHGDWIINNGDEYYPCSNETFIEIYEEVKEEESL